MAVAETGTTGDMWSPTSLSDWNLTNCWGVSTQDRTLMVLGVSADWCDFSAIIGHKILTFGPCHTIPLLSINEACICCYWPESQKPCPART